MSQGESYKDLAPRRSSTTNGWQKHNNTKNSHNQPKRLSTGTTHSSSTVPDSAKLETVSLQLFRPSFQQFRDDRGACRYRLHIFDVKKTEMTQFFSWLFGGCMFGLFVVLFVSLLLSFLAMPGLCRFLRVTLVATKRLPRNTAQDSAQYSLQCWKTLLLRTRDRATGSWCHTCWKRLDSVA